MNFSVERVRQDFPLLAQELKGRKICYLDNAVTAQKPQAVIDALVDFYTRINCNVHRGAYSLSHLATDAYGHSREAVARFLNAESSREVIFTRNATEAINLIAASWGNTFLKEGDEILISTLEHHANIIPWQLLAERKNLVIKLIPVLDTGDLDEEAYERLLSEKTRLVAVTAVSNTLGTVTPLERIIPKAKALGALVLVDACQAVPHFHVDVRKLNADFLVFTGHKLFGPNGVGCLYGRLALLEKMPPYQGGGGMIERVSLDGTSFRPSPERFEAGTPAIADAIGLKAAIDYLASLDSSGLMAHEAALLEQAEALLKEVPGLRILGKPYQRAPILSFVMDGVHPHDLATYLDNAAICVRAGHHCTQLLMRHFCVPATLRASFAFYNTFEEVNHLAHTLHAAHRFFA